MADPSKANEETLSKGVNAGLKFWLVFLLGFVLLRYPFFLSLLFGAIGGLSGGFLGWFWHKQDEPPKQEEKQEAEPEEQKEEATDRPKVLHTLMPGLSGDRAEPSTRQQPYRVERINRPSRRQLRKDRTVPLRRDR